MVTTLDLPKAMAERIVRLRGRLHPFERIDPGRTALVVVDLQNVFLAEGSAYEVPAARAVVPRVNELASAVRTRGGTVAWVRMSYDPENDWNSFYDNLLSPELAAAVRDSLRKGTHGHALWPGLDVVDGDLVVDKTRFSAFLANSSDLAQALRARGIDTVLVAGALTNTCCECSARDAMMLDFKTVMISDGCAAAIEDLHLATLRNFIQVSGDVRTTQEAITLLRRGLSEAAE